MDISLWGVAGGIAGMALGLLNYRVILRVLEPRLRALDDSETEAGRASFERKLVLLRRIVLAFELAVPGAAGYLVGKFAAGWLGGAGG